MHSRILEFGKSESRDFFCLFEKGAHLTFWIFLVSGSLVFVWPFFVFQVPSVKLHFFLDLVLEEAEAMKKKKMNFSCCVLFVGCYDG